MKPIPMDCRYQMQPRISECTSIGSNANIDINKATIVSVDFEIKFANVPALRCQLNATSLATKYLDLLKNQYSLNPNPIFRDPQNYTIAYFQQLVKQAKEQLGWDWQRDQYDIDTTTLLHKDIETYLAQGYSNIPEQHDHLLNELHFCLHAIQSGSKRDHWLQIEWFNDAGFFIDADQYPAKLHMEFGDLRLQNPYVGHHPLYVYEQQDSTNVNQTCRFHDFVKPGINIVIMPDKHHAAFDWDHYLSWFQTHGSDMLQHHGIAALKKFTGHPVIGSVANKDDLRSLLDQPVIVFESISFV